MTALVNTCFSCQPKRKERGTFRRCGVLKLHTFVIWHLSYHTTGQCGPESFFPQTFLSCL